MYWGSELTWLLGGSQVALATEICVVPREKSLQVGDRAILSRWWHSISQIQPQLTFDKHR